jgi:hypothetical protein
LASASGKREILLAASGIAAGVAAISTWMTWVSVTFQLRDGQRTVTVSGVQLAEGKIVLALAAALLALAALAAARRTRAAGTALGAVVLAVAIAGVSLYALVGADDRYVDGLHGQHSFGPIRSVAADDGVQLGSLVAVIAGIVAAALGAGALGASRRRG